MGVLIAPFALCIPIALAGTYGALAAAHRLPGRPAWAHSPALDLTIFVSLLSGLVLLLGHI